MYFRVLFYRSLAVLALAVLMLHAQGSPRLWYQLPGGAIGPVKQIITDGEGRIFASVHDKGIYRSVDTGKTWTQIAPTTAGVWSLALRPAGEIVAAVWGNGVYRTTDHGATWTAFAKQKVNADVRGVNNAGKVYIEDGGVLYRSSDNDTSWIEQSVPAGVMARSGTQIVAAKGNTIHRSTDDGTTWQSIATVPGTVYAAAFGAGNSLFTGVYCDDASPSPSLYSYQSAGNTWLAQGPPSTINAIAQRQDGVLFAASHDSGFYFSTNSGAVWKQYNNGLSTTKMYSLAILNDTTVLAGTLDGVFVSSGPLASLLPVELVSFTVTVTNGMPLLRWRTATEIDNLGFTIERRHVPSGGTERTVVWAKLGFVSGHGSSNAPQDYLFADRHPENGVMEYRLSQTDRQGAVSYIGSVIVSIALRPLTFSLDQNFPNPFNPSTVIGYDVPKEGNVSLIITDLLGRTVAIAAEGPHTAGRHTVTIDAHGWASGVYLYTIRSGTFSASRRMLLVR